MSESEPRAGGNSLPEALPGAMVRLQPLAEGLERVQRHLRGGGIIAAAEPADPDGGIGGGGRGGWTGSQLAGPRGKAASRSPHQVTLRQSGAAHHTTL